MVRAAAFGLAAMVLSACASEAPKHLQPLSYSTIAALEKKGLTEADPILLRIFKQESELEVWKKSSKDGKFRRFKTYDICKWSGQLGPKMQEGDRQAPEGFYEVTPALMNPNSDYHLSFNLGFPNAFDRAHERTGSHLMVHGACSSAGCYAMEDEQIQEIYALAREAFDAGQQSFQVQAYPFRMTPENLAMNAENEHIDFWRMLKEGNDHFEVTQRRPAIAVCDRRYIFNAATGEFDPQEACPEYEVPQWIQTAVAEKQTEDFIEEVKVLAKLEKKRQREAPAAVEEPAVMLASAPANDAAPVVDESPAVAAPTETADTAPAIATDRARTATIDKRRFIPRLRMPSVPRLPSLPGVLRRGPEALTPEPTPDAKANDVVADVFGERSEPAVPVLGYLPQAR